MEDAARELSAYGIDTPAFDLAGLQTYARVVDCYDGDTCKAVFRAAGGVYKFTLRLDGIDTCEKTGGLRRAAIKARNRLLQCMLPGEAIDLERPYKRAEIREMFARNVALIWVRCKGLDKYGRCLADLCASAEASETFQDVLLREKLAFAYYGGTKLTEEEQAATGINQE